MTREEIERLRDIVRGKMQQTQEENALSRQISDRSILSLKNFEDFKNVPYEHIMSMNRRELEKNIKKFSNRLNRQIEQINRLGIKPPSADRIGYDKEAGKLKYVGIRALEAEDLNNVARMRSELNKMVMFANSQTSNVQGVHDWMMNSYEALKAKGVDLPEMPDLKTREARMKWYNKEMGELWRLYDELKRIDPEYENSRMKYAFFDVMAKESTKKMSKQDILKMMTERKEEISRERNKKFLSLFER